MGLLTISRRSNGTRSRFDNENERTKARQEGTQKLTGLLGWLALSLVAWR
jgi:hypothetical protein